jgi:hypothetical protein
LILSLTAVLAGVGTPATGQPCNAQWQLGSDTGISGGSGHIDVMMAWDPDGSGPRSPVVVMGGNFSAAMNVRANNIAIFDPATNLAQALGSGMNGSVSALAALPNGDLVVAGSFSSAGGIYAANIARWNGTAWTPVGSGMNSGVSALAVLPNGDLVAGGDFTLAGGVIASRVARWDGSSWSALGSGVNSTVQAMTTLPNGNIVIGGQFWMVGNPNERAIALWDGSTWSSLGGGMNNTNHPTNVRAITQMPNGDLIVAGEFGTAGGVPVSNMARWNGTTWSAFGAGNNFFGAAVHALQTLPNGDIVIAGSFWGSSSLPSMIARWDGSTWNSLGTGIHGDWLSGHRYIGVDSLCVLPNGHLFAGGSFDDAGYVQASSIARWNGVEWSPLGSGVNDRVSSLLSLPDGNLLVGGMFTFSGGVKTNGIGRWTGLGWSPLGSGVAAAPAYLHGDVQALARLPNGDLIADGRFSIAGGVSVRNIARWNGSTWSAIGNGLSDAVYALATRSNGDIIAGGEFAGRFALWNGTSWVYPGLGLNGAVQAVVVLPNNHFVAAGLFDTAGGVNVSNIARWNGATWSPLGTGMNGSVNALLLLPNGDLIAGGEFTTAGGVNARSIARWNGVNWSPLGAGTDRITALSMLPNGDVVAGGRALYSAGGVAVAYLARWNGSIWLPVGGGVDNGVNALAALPAGDLAVGGLFLSAGGNISRGIARCTFMDGSAPTITDQPVSTVACRYGQASFSIAASGTDPLTYQWQIQIPAPAGPAWVDLSSASLTACGGVVTAYTPYATNMTVFIQPCPGIDRYLIRCVVSNSCGSVISDEVTDTICIADMDDGSGLGHCDRGVTLDDLLYYLLQFQLAASIADVDDGSGTGRRDGGVGLEDLLYFLQRYGDGC